MKIFVCLHVPSCSLQMDTVVAPETAAAIFKAEE
jgi:hypothetical protein